MLNPDFWFFFHIDEGMESKMIGTVPQLASRTSEKSSSNTTLDTNNPRPVLKHQPQATFASTGENLLVDTTSSATGIPCSAPSESTPGNSFRLSIEEDHRAQGKRPRSQNSYTPLIRELNLS